MSRSVTLGVSRAHRWRPRGVAPPDRLSASGCRGPVRGAARHRCGCPIRAAGWLRDRRGWRCPYRPGKPGSCQRSFRSVLRQRFGRYVRDPVHHYVTDLAFIDKPQELLGGNAQFTCGLRGRRRVLSTIATSIGAEFQLTVQAADLDLGQFCIVVGRPKGHSGLLQSC